MNPRLVMRRAQKTLLGISCIAGGCAAMVWMVSNNHALDRWLNLLESRASAEETAAPVTAEAPLAAEIDAAVAVATDAAREADLAPQSRVVIPEGRPEWVDADFTHEQGDLQRRAISSGPYKRKHDALRALDEELLKVTSEYVADYLGNRAAATLVPVDVATIRNSLVRPGNIYHEQIQISEIGPMHQSHALLEFTPSFRHQLDERWKALVMTGRVAKLGVIGIAVLLALSVVFGYFKADNATRGYYTTRLQVGTAGAILALVAGGVMLLRYL